MGNTLGAGALARSIRHGRRRGTGPCGDVGNVAGLLRDVGNVAGRSRVGAVALTAALLLAVHSRSVEAVSPQARASFQRSIIDKRTELNPRFKKVRRTRTQYIIVHTSEGGLKNTLSVVLDGKHNGRSRRLTYGGHTHYVIARDGRTFRTLDKSFRADHAGRSMWNGQDDISSVSIGIELVGYHHTQITSKQYHALGILIDILQDIYRLDDRAVLTHSQVAYGRPNRWVRTHHRGRKRCAKNFVRSRAGVRDGWAYDPDVRSGRLTADAELASLYYGPRREQPHTGSAIVTASNTAWMIAGEDYNAATTSYRLPSGRVVPGDQLGTAVGWRRIPPGTVVLLNTRAETVQKDVDLPVSTLSNGQTAWTFAGADYRKNTTMYIFPNGRVKHGGQITDWDGLPPHTRIAVGYHGPYRVTRARPPVTIAGQQYRNADTLYIFPDRSIMSGKQIRDFRRLPSGVRILVPVETS